MKLKKRLFVSLVMAFMFCILGVNTKYINATPIVITGITSYSDLKTYLEKTDGNEYILQLASNINVTDTIMVYGKKTIDGAGSGFRIINALTNIDRTGECKNNSLSVAQGADLTVQNGLIFDGSNKYTKQSSNIIVSGKLTVSNTDFYDSTQGIHVSETGELHFDSGNIKPEDYDMDMGIGSRGTVYFTGGTILGKNGSHTINHGIHINGQPHVSTNPSKGILWMSGGTIDQCTTGIIVFNGNANGTTGVATISAGTISNSRECGITNGLGNGNIGTVNINGSATINGAGNQGIYNNLGSTVNIQGGLIHL